MFERYSTRARRVIFFARYAASQVGSPFIETEHLLLGVLRIGLNLIDFANLDVQEVRLELGALTAQRPHTSTSEDLPLSQESKRVLALGAEECEGMGHAFIGPEHLLLGLLREGKCLAADLLHKRGVRLAKLREEIAKTGPAEAAGARVGLRPGMPGAISGETVSGGGGAGFAPRAARFAGQFSWFSLLPQSGRILHLARFEAVQRQSAYIGSAELLLALTHEKEVTERFLIPAKAVRTNGSLTPAVPGEKVSAEKLPFSEDFKLPCTLAVQEAAHLGQPAGLGHLLLGILRVESCAAARPLGECGISAAGIRALLAPPPPSSDLEQGRSYV